MGAPFIFLIKAINFMKQSSLVMPKNIKPKGVRKGDLGLMNRNGVLTIVDENSVESPVGLGPANNYIGTTLPAVTDDSGDGYAVGSLWINTVTNEAYRCVDATLGAAIWIETTFDAAEVAALIQAAFTATVFTPATNYEVPSQAAGTYSGQRKIFHITPVGAGDLTIHASIKIPSDSGITFPKAMTAGDLYIVQLSYSIEGGFWMLNTLLGGFA